MSAQQSLCYSRGDASVQLNVKKCRVVDDEEHGTKFRACAAGGVQRFTQNTTEKLQQKEKQGVRLHPLRYRVCVCVHGAGANIERHPFLNDIETPLAAADAREQQPRAQRRTNG